MNLKLLDRKAIKTQKSVKLATLSSDAMKSVTGGGGVYHGVYAVYSASA